MVLSESARNGGGGRTPWNSWISCEEKFGNGTGIGNIYQVDKRAVATIRFGNLSKTLQIFKSPIRIYFTSPIL